MSELEDKPEEYIFIPEEVVMRGGNPHYIFNSRAQIRHFINNNKFWFEDQCSFCSNRPEDRHDLLTRWFYSRGFGNFKVNLCDDCEFHFPDFMNDTMEYYWELPGDC